MADLLTPDELAERLKVTAGTINKWRKSGILPAIQITATIIRFDYEAVLDALKARSEARR